MEFTQTTIEGLVIVRPHLFEDNRGWFAETYTKREFEKYGIRADFIQDNQAFNFKKGTLRGLHLQKDPMAQAKLVQCLKGSIMDFAVDLRKSSSTYKKWFSVELSAENKSQLFIPKGFAHGYVTLEDDTCIFYKVDAFYARECEVTIRYNDPEIGIDWGIEDPILSQKDSDALCLKDIASDL